MRKLAVPAAGLAIFAVAAWGDPSEAANKVDEGLERYRAGAFADAAQAFADAQAALPGDPRIAFDRGCALAAQGELDAAIAPLHEAALARDPDLAARARFNLGTTGIAAAKKAFGEKPEEAAPDARKKDADDLSGKLADRTVKKGAAKGATKAEHAAVQAQSEEWVAHHRVLADAGESDVRIQSLLDSAAR